MNCVSYRTTTKSKQSISDLARILSINDSEIVRKSIQLYMHEASEPNRNCNCTVVVDEKTLEDLKAYSKSSGLSVSRIIHLCVNKYVDDNQMKLVSFKVFKETLVA